VLLSGVTSPGAQAAQLEVNLQVTGLEDLGPGWAYEGWLIEDGTSEEQRCLYGKRARDAEPHRLPNDRG
jgi:hypothetical protein